jgi:hypothetical protein
MKKEIYSFIAVGLLFSTLGESIEPRMRSNAPSTASSNFVYAQDSALPSYRRPDEGTFVNRGFSNNIPTEPGIYPNSGPLGQGTVYVGPNGGVGAQGSIGTLLAVPGYPTMAMGQRGGMYVDGPYGTILELPRTTVATGPLEQAQFYSFQPRNSNIPFSATGVQGPFDNRLTIGNNGAVYRGGVVDVVVGPDGNYYIKGNSSEDWYGPINPEELMSLSTY